jgi:BirA family biotin operon repressor/biotin-[acetyl-CoA-carboxylase] ligase
LGLHPFACIPPPACPYFIGMLGRPSAYDVDRIRRHIGSHGCAAAFHYAPTVDSTNQWAKRMLAEVPHGTVLLADAQTAGRGRFGRTWYSPGGVSIYMSWVLKTTDLPAAGVFWNFAAAWAVAGVLERDVPELEAKWPNDLWVQGRKLAGFLTERLYAGTRPQGIVVGIGLNVHPTEWPCSMDVRPVSLEEVTGRRWDRTDLVIAVVDALAQAERLWQAGYAADLLREWFQKARWQPGQETYLRVHGQLRRARIVAVEADGSLQVRLAGTEDVLRLPVEAALGWET